MLQLKEAFGPEAISVLTAAFDKAWESFLHSYDRHFEERNKMRDELAACIIESFKRGEMDSSQLARDALAELRRRELSLTQFQRVQRAPQSRAAIAPDK